MLLTEPNLHCAGPLVLLKSCNIFPPNIGEDQKKSHHLSVGTFAGTVPNTHIIVNLALVIVLRL